MGKTQTRSDIETFLDAMDQADYVAVDTTAVAGIAQLTNARAALDERLTNAVLSAREAGHSWGHIAIALRVSRQAARQKYGPLEKKV